MLPHFLPQPFIQRVPARVWVRLQRREVTPLCVDSAHENLELQEGADGTAWMSHVAFSCGKRVLYRSPVNRVLK